jgi:cysteine desulfurase/selenocysteine lyase
LNNAGTGPLPERSIRVAVEWARLRATPNKVAFEQQFGALERARELISRLIGSDPAEIALATNTTYGVNLAAFSLPLQRGDVVLSPDQEFPANVYPWMALAQRRGVEYRQIRCHEDVLDVERLERELEDDRVKCVTVSWVQAVSGARVDVEALGRLCKDRGVFFVVDAIQGLSALEIDLRHVHVDILASGAQKWLVGPWGSGFVYVRKALIEQLEPHDVSWLAMRGADDFTKLLDYDFTWRDSARKFEFITLPYQDMAAMNSSLELIHELGPAAVSAHTLSLAQAIVDWAADRDDVELVTPADPTRRAGIVAVRPSDSRAASARLNAAGVAHALRESGIRLSPHFYNTREEVERALSIIA